MASPLRRSTRNALSVISTPSTSTVDVNQNVTNVRLPSALLTPSPDEQIIQSRSRRAAAHVSLQQIKALSAAGLTPDDCDDDSDQMYTHFETPPKTPKPSSPKKRILQTTQKNDAPERSPRGSPRKQPSRSPTKSPKKARIQRPKPIIPLSNELKALSHDQLVGVIEVIVSNHPELEQDVRDTIPPPDITPLKENLYKLQRNIYKSFPNTRWGSSRDSFCYRRVRTHIETFKKTCIDQGKTLLSAQSYEATIDYVLAAWKFVDETPRWDDEAHNRSRKLCFKQLAGICLNAIKKSVLEKEVYGEFRHRLADAVLLSDELKPCITHIDRVLCKLS